MYLCFVYFLCFFIYFGRMISSCNISQRILFRGWFVRRMICLADDLFWSLFCRISKADDDTVKHLVINRSSHNSPRLRLWRHKLPIHLAEVFMITLIVISIHYHWSYVLECHTYKHWEWIVSLVSRGWEFVFGDFHCYVIFNVTFKKMLVLLQLLFKILYDFVLMMISHQWYVMQRLHSEGFGLMSC